MPNQLAGSASAGFGASGKLDGIARDLSGAASAGFRATGSLERLLAGASSSGFGAFGALEVAHELRGVASIGVRASGALADLSYQEAEASVAATPIELYEFVTPSQTYRLTSHSQSYTFDGETYRRAVIERGSVKADHMATDELMISIARDEDVIKDSAFSIPSRSMQMTLRRVYSAEIHAVVWQGAIGAVSVDGDRASVSVLGWWANEVAKPVPAVRYQGRCNHRLYDDRCGVDPDEFEINTAIASVTSDTEIEVASVGSNPDQWLRHGVLVHVASGERRSIVNHEGSTVTISWPMLGIDESDEVALFAGCDLSVEECLAKFDNVQQFGGHPFIPARNLSQTIRGITPPAVEGG